MTTIRKVAPPNLPLSPTQYSSLFQEQYSNVLRLFFNQITNVVNVNTATPYGSFYDTSNQSNPGASVPQTIHLSNTSSAYKTSVVDGTTVNAKVFVAESGIYNIQFSAQVEKSGSGYSDVYFWLRQNGVDIKESGGVTTLTGNGARSKLITSWNYVLPLQAGDYVQLAWTSSDTSVTLPYFAATASIPASPSVIFTINWVSSIAA
jgi:hypothetical protein